MDKNYVEGIDLSNKKDVTVRTVYIRKDNESKWVLKEQHIR